MIIQRRLAGHIQDLGRYFPIISLTGPRQAGKTTLLQELFRHYRYVSFEDPEYRRRFQDDPRSFLEQYNGAVIFDEAQRVPDLFSYLQGIVDQDRRPGRFILSGSQNFLLMQGLSQSLAGRVGVARLLPLDHAELLHAGLLKDNPWEVLYNGYYPVHYQIDMPPRFFYPNYLATYLERDVADWVNASNLATFRRFIQFCATLTSQTVNRALIAKSIGIAVATVNNWLSILERSYILFLLPPYFNNFGKRLVKQPKLYFFDTGLAAYLLELTGPKQVRESSYQGALFENMMIADRLKQLYHQGDKPNLYFFRDSNGVEVDLLETQNEVVSLTEIKSGTTYLPAMANNLNKIAALFHPNSCQKTMVYTGGESFRVKDLAVQSWSLIK